MSAPPYGLSFQDTYWCPMNLFGFCRLLQFEHPSIELLVLALLIHQLLMRSSFDDLTLLEHQLILGVAKVDIEELYIAVQLCIHFCL